MSGAEERDNTIVLCTLVLNEMEHLPKLYEQHKDWPGMLRWVFVESADRMYAQANPSLVTHEGLSVDGTTEYLSKLACDDDRVFHIPYGFCSAQDPAQGKCEARSIYLRLADEVKPKWLWVLDGDEFYTRDSQVEVVQWMNRLSGWTAYCFPFTHIWRPPSLAECPLFQYEVRGGFWDIPLCRGWRWFPRLRYRRNHNTPETPGGMMLDRRIKNLYEKPRRFPHCIHMAFTSSARMRHAKNAYYRKRGEGRVDHRRWYVQSRAAYETWTPGDPLPHGARVMPYRGPVPECFRGTEP